ncbi:MAG: translation initiation factor IF-2 [Patescibacteria group bacterium]
MNITELARKLKITTEQLKDELPKLGFDIGRRAIKIDDAAADKVMKLWAEKKSSVPDNRYFVTEKKLNEVVPQAEKKSVALPMVCTVRELAEILHLPVTNVIAELFKNGIMAAMNERIDFDTATIIAQDLGFATTAKNFSEEIKNEVKTNFNEADNEKSDNLVARPPVVVVMGHVDHGKTTLLDAIRETNIAAGESGAITQHIGAYQAEEKGRKITFLDTPGHEAFAAMRARGGRIADVAIIVVAADDGLQPQTLEAIEIAQREQLPFLFAINKIDKENADIERVKKALADLNLLPEDWGGKTICVPIAAKKKQGIPELLDMVLLLSDLAHLVANPNKVAGGTVIESRLDKGEGPVATVLVQTGTLHLGDMIILGEATGKIKAMRDYLGKPLTQATPSTPVRILGLKQVPKSGEVFRVTRDEAEVKEIARSAPRYQKTSPIFNPLTSSVADKNNEVEATALPTLKLILKTDVLGSREAIVSSLAQFDSREVKVKLVRMGLGSINENDVLEAEATGALLLGFNVPIMPVVEILARRKNVFIKSYKVIYDLLDEVKKHLQSLLKPELVRTQLGEALVVQIFKRGKRDMIVGCKIKQGLVRPKTKAQVIRGDSVIAVLELTEIRIGKEIVGEVAEGSECGFGLKGEPIVEEKDILEIYHEEIRQRII